MRLKKVKGAQEKIDKSKYIIKNPKDYKGKYNELFNNDNKIEIEIGMGKGNFIIGKALKNPDINYIAIYKILISFLPKESISFKLEISTFSSFFLNIKSLLLSKLYHIF